MQKLKLPEGQQQKLLVQVQGRPYWQLVLMVVATGIAAAIPDCLPIFDEAFLLTLFGGSLWTLARRAWNDLTSS